MSTRRTAQRKLTLKKFHVKERSIQSSIHRYASTARKSEENLKLLFQLQRMAYPELNGDLRMNRKKVKLIKR